MVEIRVRDFKAEVGCVLARPYWGQGFVTEAVQAITDWAIQQPHIFRVWAVCDVENVGSARVLEKVGMTKEGILRRWHRAPNITDEPRDCLCYARVK